MNHDGLGIILAVAVQVLAEFLPRVGLRGPTGVAFRRFRMPPSIYTCHPNGVSRLRDGGFGSQPRGQSSALIFFEKRSPESSHPTVVWAFDRL